MRNEIIDGSVGCESEFCMRLLFIGDVVGRSGRRAVIEHLPKLREKFDLDFVVVNGENCAAGFGITEKILNDLLDAGTDVVTLGNHAFDQRDALVFIERTDRMLRPMNFPPGTPGKGSGVFKARNGANILIINALGRVFMSDVDCPFRAIDQVLTECPMGSAADAVLVDFHAEATSEKQALGQFLDGRVSVVVGTHTHAPTADERVLPNGTAYMSDAGMTGDYQSILGMNTEEPINRFLTKIPKQRFEPALGEATLCGLAVEIDDGSGHAKKVRAVRLGGLLPSQEPEFWLT